MGFFKSKRGPVSDDAVASTRSAEPTHNQAGPSKKLWQTGTLRNRATKIEPAAVRPPPVQNQDVVPQLSLDLVGDRSALVNLDTSSSPWVDLGDDGSNSVKGLLGFSDSKPGQVNSRLKALLDDAKLTVEQTTTLVQDCTAVLRQQGLETLGLFRPWRSAEDPYFISRALGFFLHTTSPDGPAIPLAEADFLRFGQATLQDVLADIGPHNVAACLKWGLRHLRYGPGGFSDAANPTTSWQFYTTFVQKEEAADLPKDAYSKLLLPSLPTSHGKLLTAVLDLISMVAAHADETAMTGSHLCGLLAFWLFNRQQATWNTVEDLYIDFQTASTALEHFFLCYLRSQDKLPLRLSELLQTYPPDRQMNVNSVGVRTFLHSTDEWPSLFAIVSLGEEFPSRLPRTGASKKHQNLLEDWQKLAHVCKHGDTVILHELLSEETQRIFDLVAAKAASKAQAKQIKWQDANGSWDRRRSTSLNVGMGMHSASDSGHGKMSTGSSVGTLPNRSATHLPALSRSTSATPASWTDFEKNGFLADEDDADTFSLITDFGPTSPTTEYVSQERPNKLKKSQFPAVKSAKTDRLLAGPSQEHEYETEAKDEYRDAEIQQLRVLPLDQAFVEMYQDSLDDVRETATWPIFAVAELKPLGPPYRALLIEQRRTTIVEKQDLKLKAIESGSKELTSETPLQPSKKEKKGFLSLKGRRKRASELFARKGSNDSTSNLSTRSEVPTEALPALDEFGMQRVRPMRAVTQSVIQREPPSILPQPTQRPIPVIIKTSPLTPPRYFPARSQTMPTSPSSPAPASGKRVPGPQPQNTETESTAANGELPQPAISQSDGDDIFAVEQSQAAPGTQQETELGDPAHAAANLRVEPSSQPPTAATVAPATVESQPEDVNVTDTSYFDEAVTAFPELPVNGKVSSAQGDSAESSRRSKPSNAAEPENPFSARQEAVSDSPSMPQAVSLRIEDETRATPTMHDCLSSETAPQIKTGQSSVDVLELPETRRPLSINTVHAETEADKTEAAQMPFEENASPPQLEVGTDSVAREEVPAADESSPAASPVAASTPATDAGLPANDSTDRHSEPDLVEILEVTAPAESIPVAANSVPAALPTAFEIQKDVERDQLDKDIERALNARKKSISSISRPKLRSVSSSSLASDRSQQGQSTSTRSLQTRPSLILTGPDSPSSPALESGETSAKKIGGSFNRVSPTLKARLAGTFSNDTPGDPQSPTSKAQKLAPAAEPSSPSKRSKLLSEAKRFLNRKKSTPDVAVKAVPAPKESAQQEPVAIERTITPPLAEEPSLTTSSEVKVEPTVLTPVSEAPSEATIAPETAESTREEDLNHSSATQSTEPTSDGQMSLDGAPSLPIAGESEIRDELVERSTAYARSSTPAPPAQEDLKENKTSTEDLASTTMSDDVVTPDIRSRTPGAFFTPFSEISEPLADVQENEVESMPVEQAEDLAASNLFGSLVSVPSAVTKTVTEAAQSVLPENMGGHHERQEAGTNATDEGFVEESGLQSASIDDKAAEHTTPLRDDEPTVHPSEPHPLVRTTSPMSSTAEEATEEARDTHSPNMRQSPPPATGTADLKTEQPSAEPTPAGRDAVAAEQKLVESDEERRIDLRSTARVQESTSTALARARAILEKRRNVSGGSTNSAAAEVGRGSPVLESKVESGTNEG